MGVGAPRPSEKPGRERPRRTLNPAPDAGQAERGTALRAASRPWGARWGREGEEAGAAWSV